MTGRRGRAAALLFLTLALSRGLPAFGRDEALAFPAGGDEAAEEEEELFGTPQASTTASQNAFTGVPESSPRPIERDLVIGGLLYSGVELRNRDGMSIEATPLRSPQILYGYADARPNDRVRIFARARMIHDVALVGSTAGNPSRGSLDQLWIRVDTGRAFVTIGRQPVKWGTGLVWNPTDFLNPPRDPLAIVDDRVGVGLVKLQVPFPSLGLDVTAVADIEGASTLGDVGGALLATWLVSDVEIGFSTASRKNEPLRFGATVASHVGIVDFRLEGALLHGVTTPFFSGYFIPEIVFIPDEYSRRDDWIPRAVAGFDLPLRYSDQDSVRVGTEYFFNDAGYPDASLYPWLIARGTFVPYYNGRHYVAAFIHAPSPGPWNDGRVLVYTLGNLSDGSWVSRLEVGTRVFTYLDVSVLATAHYGQVGEFRFGVDVAPAPIIPGLEEGISIPPQRLDLGVWLSMPL